MKEEVLGECSVSAGDLAGAGGAGARVLALDNKEVKKIAAMLAKEHSSLVLHVL